LFTGKLLVVLLGILSWVLKKAGEQKEMGHLNTPGFAAPHDKH
jgi:hypothetical protein